MTLSQPLQGDPDVRLLSFDPQLPTPTPLRSQERLTALTEGGHHQIASLAHHRKMGASSTSQRYRIETRRDPIGEIREELAAAWGDPDQEREVAWTFFLRVGMITGTKP